MLKKHVRKHGLLLDHDDRHRFDNGGTLRKSAPLPPAEQNEQGMKQIYRWIVSGSLPFSVIDNREFVRLLRLFDPTYVIPSRHTILRRIVAMPEERVVEIRRILASECASVSITADTWSSRVYKGYMVLTAHWINSEWEHKSTVLDLVRFAIPRTGEAAAALIFNVLEHWGLSRKVRTITTDIAGDICVGVGLLREKLYRVGQTYRSLDDF